jgi:hypothetical protein
MGTKLRERIYGPSIRAAAEWRRKPARKPTGLRSKRGTRAFSGFRVRRNDRRRWATQSMLVYRDLEVRCLGCNTHQTVALEIVLRRQLEQGEIGPDLFRHACLMGFEGLVS